MIESCVCYQKKLLYFTGEIQFWGWISLILPMFLSLVKFGKFKKRSKGRGGDGSFSLVVEHHSDLLCGKRGAVINSSPQQCTDCAN